MLVGAAALVALLGAHAVITRLRVRPVMSRIICLMSRIIDKPVRVLVRDGRRDHRQLRLWGLTDTDLASLLRQHGHLNLAEVHLMWFEGRAAVSVLTAPGTVGPPPHGHPAPVNDDEEQRLGNPDPQGPSSEDPKKWEAEHPDPTQ